MDLSYFFKNKIILIIGGTGSIGSELTSQLLKFSPKTIRIFSNSENELWESKLKFQDSVKNIRFLLGDIRDFERIKRATQDVDYIFNAAAIKHVPISEYNPMEAISINIHGLENTIEAAFINNVKKIINLSTDKAVIPTTVMGATNMLAERLCISREMAKGEKVTSISCVRFGNVLGSRGSIIPLVKEQLKNGNIITLTDENMKRFFLSITQAVELIIKASVLAQGGEIFVLKMRTIRIRDLIDCIIEKYSPLIGKDAASIRIEKIGSRLGEKLNEEILSPIEFSYCFETDDMYIIYPPRYLEENHLKKKINKNANMINQKKKIHYSTKNQKSLSKMEINELINELNILKEN